MKYHWLGILYTIFVVYKIGMHSLLSKQTNTGKKYPGIPRGRIKRHSYPPCTSMETGTLTGYEQKRERFREKKRTLQNANCWVQVKRYNLNSAVKIIDRRILQTSDAVGI